MSLKKGENAMGNIEIAQIQNTALKAAALEVDESGKKDGYIDSNEINLFTDKATALLSEKKCTAQELAVVINTNEINKSNIADVFAKADSLHNAKNSPEALKEEAEKLKQAEKQAEKQEKIQELKVEIADNDKKLELYEKRLAQKEISWYNYIYDGISSFLKIQTGATLTIVGGASLALGAGLYAGSMGLITNSVLPAVIGVGAGGIGAAALVLSAGMLFYSMYKGNRKSSSEEQEKWRNAYKEAYLEISQKNEQLKTKLAELQK